ncbi:phosphonate ABC transporter, permease protein PhnE [Lacimonas salitolerans]|uniref:Phosphonate ABC transporter, permease protein PhnE n=1 Tax=Lacimonas salitolerans TaxID=1323750 RepID=A0ABW4EL80_9RHOB
MKRATSHWRAKRPELFPPRGPRAWVRWALIMIGIVFFFLGLEQLGFGWSRLVAGGSRLGTTFALMVPPVLNGQEWVYLKAIGETLAMAFLGTLVAAVLAIPLGFMGARNIMPFGPLRFILRRSSDVVRGLDALIWAIFFVSVVGLGPFAGILAIAVNDTAVLTKLTSEALENIDREQTRGVRATGAGPLGVARFGALPQVFPVLLGNALYFLESNVRSATILGVVGAGGIGFFLMDRMMLSAWREVSAIVLMILVTVAVIDVISGRLRARLIGRQA